jgi:hypothetical protein
MNNCGTCRWWKEDQLRIVCEKEQTHKILVLMVRRIDELNEERKKWPLSKWFERGFAEQEKAIENTAKIDLEQVTVATKTGCGNCTALPSHLRTHEAHSCGQWEKIGDPEEIDISHHPFDCRSCPNKDTKSVSSCIACESIDAPKQVN